MKSIEHESPRSKIEPAALGAGLCDPEALLTPEERRKLDEDIARMMGASLLTEPVPESRQ